MAGNQFLKMVHNFFLITDEAQYLLNKVIQLTTAIQKKSSE